MEFQLFGNLAFAYTSRPNDEVNELIGTPPIRRVVRKISSTFWFFRELFPYGEDCELIAPSVLRSAFRQKVQALAAIYDS